MVYHTQMLDTLEKIGERGISLNFFETYLQKRVQYVIIGVNFVDNKTIAQGKLQGTVFVPVHFSRYIYY